MSLPVVWLWVAFGASSFVMILGGLRGLSSIWVWTLGLLFFKRFWWSCCRVWSASQGSSTFTRRLRKSRRGMSSVSAKHHRVREFRV